MAKDQTMERRQIPAHLKTAKHVAALVHWQNAHPEEERLSPLPGPREPPALTPAYLQLLDRFKISHPEQQDFDEDMPSYAMPEEGPDGSWMLNNGQGVQFSAGEDYKNKAHQAILDGIESMDMFPHTLFANEASDAAQMERYLLGLEDDATVTNNVGVLQATCKNSNYVHTL